MPFQMASSFKRLRRKVTMKYSERDEIVTGLKQLIEFLESSRGPEVPAFTIRPATWVYRYAKGSYKVDNEITKNKMVKIAKALGFAKKTQQSSYFELCKEFNRYVKLRFTSSREAVCTPRITGYREEKVTESIETG